MTELTDKLYSLISEDLGVEKDKLSRESDFFHDLNINKVELTDLLLKVQEIFKVEIPREEYVKLTTVGELIDLVGEYVDEI